MVVDVLDQIDVLVFMGMLENAVKQVGDEYLIIFTFYYHFILFLDFSQITELDRVIVK